MRLLLGTLLGLAVQAASPAEVNTLEARIAAYGSGSAFAVLDANDKLRRVKLTGVDAPELKQPRGDQARRFAHEWIGSGAIVVIVDAVRSDGRIHGRINVEGEDFGLKLLGAGLAWCDPHDAGDLPEALRLRYSETCETAKRRRAGLWLDHNPMPPWEFRRIPQFDPLPSTTDAPANHCRRIGYGSFECDDGRRLHVLGRDIRSSDGTIYTRRGHTITGSDGSFYQRQRAFVYGSDGTVCRARGRTVECY